jgi:hypothetical protein
MCWRLGEQTEHWILPWQGRWRTQALWLPDSVLLHPAQHIITLWEEEARVNVWSMGTGLTAIRPTWQQTHIGVGLRSSSWQWDLLLTREGGQWTTTSSPLLLKRLSRSTSDLLPLHDHLPWLFPSSPTRHCGKVSQRLSPNHDFPCFQTPGYLSLKK